MKLAILAAGAAMFLAAATPVPAADLRIDIATRGGGGSLAIAVYRDAEAFRRGERPVATRTVRRGGPVTAVTFSGLAPGRYAVAAFHDQDGDGALTLWPFGLPKEPYGFSRDARGRFGPPSFDSAAFDLTADGGRQSFSLR